MSHAQTDGKASIGRQTLIVLFAIILTVAVNLFWWLYYSKTAAQFEAQLEARLKSLAIAGAGYLQPDEVDNLLAGDIAVYFKALDYLNYLSAADSVSQIFVLDSDFRIQVSSLLESDSVYLLANLNSAALAEVLSAGFDTENMFAATVTESYPVGDLILKTAFAPLYGAGGSVVAAIAVEADVNYTETLSELKGNLTLATAISILAALIFAAVFLLVQRRIAHAERASLRSESEMNLGRMVAVVSHEIKNPLMILRSAAERIQKKTDIREAGFLIDEVDRLNEIVTGYLDFARSPDKVSLQYVPLESVMNALRDPAGQLRPRLEQEGVAFTSLIPPTNDALANRCALVDTAALRQVIINLILNAADAANQAAAQDKSDSFEPEVRLKIEVAAERLSVHVIDNGLGIEPKMQKRLFEPFYTTKQKGSGLGLYLCKQLIERMRGTITVQSSTNGPTEFTVTLPLVSQTEATSSVSRVL